MFVVISPAKKLDETRSTELPLSTPRFLHDTEALLEATKALSQADLQKLMHISPALAALNHGRFQGFAAQTPGPAALMFDGDTYTGLDAPSLSEDALRYGQAHLGILSGLYGLLRPLDAMRPYRLEMGSRLATARGKDLYGFWGTKIADALNDQAAQTGANWLLNCASQEYFGAVDRGALGLSVITPTFLEDKPAGPKVVSFYAKQARGALARFVIENRLRDPLDLRAWGAGGYVYQPDKSTPEAPVFLRPAAPSKARKAA